MSVAASLRNGIRLLVPLALASTIYLYLYPFFNSCAFPLPSRDGKEAFDATRRLHWAYPHEDKDETARLPRKLAPFRLLALGDPQLEGDTSIPTAYLGTFPHVKSIAKQLKFRTEHSSLRERLRQTAHDVVDVYFEDIPYLLASWRKRFDLLGNDFYLAHIYRTVHWWARPTHVTVLGDLVGSQWIDDDEFERRGERFWRRTFRGAERVPDEVASWPEHEYDVAGMLDGSEKEAVWARRILNIAGNHDIGYAGDLTSERLERFERVFGKVNYEVRFGLPINMTTTMTTTTTTRLRPEIRIIVLNDMNLDTPAGDTSIQDATYHFLNSVIGTSAAVEHEGIFTLVLTHIPLHKAEGVCVDAPYFDFHSEEEGGGLKEQNLLSGDASKGFLEGIYGMSGDSGVAGQGRGREGLILNGHDHEGCDTYHFINQSSSSRSSSEEVMTTTGWEAVRWSDAQGRGLRGLAAEGLPGRREITVRSMMGDFGGNAGLLSVWFDEETWSWEHEFVNCALGSQHIWWLTHILDLVAVLFCVLHALVAVLSAVGVDVDGHVYHGIARLGRRASKLPRKQ